MSVEEVRVVVVDDHRDTVEALALLLEMDGYAVRTASGVSDAISVIEEFDPICVLMDINMPDVAGHELSARLRARYGNDITLVAVTGWGMRTTAWTKALRDSITACASPSTSVSYRNCFHPSDRFHQLLVRL